MLSSIKMEEYVEPELSGIFWIKMTCKNIMLGSLGTHFMHMRVKTLVHVYQLLITVVKTSALLDVANHRWYALQFPASSKNPKWNIIND